MNAKHWIAALTVGVGVAGWVAACGSDESSVMGPGVGGYGNGGSTSQGGGTGGNLFDGGPSDCTTNADCDGGVCHEGTCCDSAEHICGPSCCTGQEVCLFDQCLIPGQNCQNAADCPEGSYCEPALGEPGDGGVVDAGDLKCTAAIPPNGRCVPLPPICEGDAGADAGCIPSCEYHPPPGELHAVVKWQWGYDPAPTEFTDSADVWSTPTVARIYDANCDGEVDLSDPPQIVFVSGNSRHTCCQCDVCAGPPSCCQTGVLRMLDGASGQEIWSLEQAKPGNTGFAGASVAIGDVDGDQRLDVVALTGDGYVVLINDVGEVQRISDLPVPNAGNAAFGWGGGVALGDMDGDGHPEIAFGSALYETTNGAITQLFVGAQGQGGAVSQRMSYFVDLDGDADGALELLAGRTAYRRDGSMLWNLANWDGFTAVGDFADHVGPEVVLVFNGALRVLDALDGTVLAGPLDIPGTGGGGPPTIADFDGDGQREVGVAMQNLYSVIEVDLATATLTTRWSQTNHDMSSSVSGSSVFDFDGDGKAEVVYKDECYQWVYAGDTGEILFTYPAQSFTGTEASLVADIDGDGHAEMLVVSNAADPTRWTCAHHNAEGVIVAPHTEPFPVWQPPDNAPDYRGITALGDLENSWVGTRTLWNQHAYFVTNICDPRDSACGAGASYGQIPPDQLNNWELPWLNNFRQNVQDRGLFDAPDATISLTVECLSPVPIKISVRNLGLSGLPAGVMVDVIKLATPELVLGRVATSQPLLPGQTEVIEFTAPAADATVSDTFIGRIVIPDPPNFHECRDDNNESAPVTANCVQ